MARKNKVRHVDAIFLDLVEVEAMIREEGRLPKLVQRHRHLVREYRMAMDALLIAEDCGASAL